MSGRVSINQQDLFDLVGLPGTESWGHIHTQLMGAGHGGHIIKIDSIENPDYTIGTANKYVVLSGRNTGGIGGLQWQREIILKTS